MKRLIAILALSTAFGVAACDSPRTDDPEVAEAPMDLPIAPPAEEASEPVAEPSAVSTRPVDASTLPPEKRSSAESVRPESETLFY